MALNGLWRIDGVDIWQNFKIFLEDGSAEFLKYPPRKQSVEHDWEDADGVDVDLTRIFTGKRQGTLNFGIVANSTAEYFTNHDAFFALWKKPGTRRLEFAAHGDRSYYVHYQDCTAWEQVGPLTVGQQTYLIAHKFSILVVEPEPKPFAASGNTYIVTEDNKFLIA